MGISLSKGNNVSLTKQAPGLSAVTVGLGWDIRATSGADFDLDSSAIVCGANSQALSGPTSSSSTTRARRVAASRTAATTGPVPVRATTSS